MWRNPITTTNMSLPTASVHTHWIYLAIPNIGWSIVMTGSYHVSGSINKGMRAM